ncbi:RNA polymerase sigma factor region1.1 domain-containing protein [Roseiarcaceae bacterium H3SJ34-1]|uniref:RNA polymerase sigma factor region1.1 domain-containing protein n=1 Tax=Terripilifer ovatus TaxID=3032367 RepID=UPI003AB95843|nr:RNA polymerase sigma factor region1.1 domain-containing protein [Roseiarcaceae bacterium H3SJ34-1]
MIPDDIKQALAKLVETARDTRRFALTTGELNAVLPDRDLSNAEVEDIYNFLWEHGIEIEEG